jgi:hypothetical protein
MNKITVVGGEDGMDLFVRTRELITAAQVSWPEGATCAVLTLAGEGLALSIQLSAEALEGLTNSGYWVLSQRGPVREVLTAPPMEACAPVLPPPANAPVGACG